MNLLSWRLFWYSQIYNLFLNDYNEWISSQKISTLGLCSQNTGMHKISPFSQMTKQQNVLALAQHDKSQHCYRHTWWSTETTINWYKLLPIVDFWLFPLYKSTNKTYYWVDLTCSRIPAFCPEHWTNCPCHLKEGKSQNKRGIYQNHPFLWKQIL